MIKYFTDSLSSYQNVFGVAREQLQPRNSLNFTKITFFQKRTLNLIAAMKVFQAVQTNFISLGFNPKLVPFNRIFVRNISIAAFGTTLLWIFLVYEADNSQEYIESTYFIAACVGIGFAAMHTIFHTNKLFSFFDRFEKLVNQSK